MAYAHIDNFEAYRVSDGGWVETKWRSGQFYSGFEIKDVWRVMRHSERPDGYHGIELRDGRGHSRRTYVHILVCESFNGRKPFQGACVRHLDGNPSNNVSGNLAWGTHAENEADKIIHGTWDSRFGGKLSAQQRDNIRRRVADGESQREIAEEFNVSRPTITRLVNDTTWSGGR